ncbi:MAG: hypothetical protein OSB21_10950, partial [Myxococcota bacterium]|nr:hypothetical protein [Myxococcota bacterium]
MLELGLDTALEKPRFEGIALGEEMTWKYRGQVVPSNNIISSTLEITEIIRDDQSVLARANASLWVDDKRIYEAENLGMRLIST